MDAVTNRIRDAVETAGKMAVVFGVAGVFGAVWTWVDMGEWVPTLTAVAAVSAGLLALGVLLLQLDSNLRPLGEQPRSAPVRIGPDDLGISRIRSAPVRTSPRPFTDVKVTGDLGRRWTR